MCEAQRVNGTFRERYHKYHVLTPPMCLPFGLSVAVDRWAPELAKIDHKISRYINGSPVRIDGRRASGLLDTVSPSVLWWSLFHPLSLGPERKSTWCRITP